MNLRLVFDNKINDILIPNALPQFILDDFINHVKVTGNDEYRIEYSKKYDGAFLPYSSNWDLYWTTHDIDITSDLEPADDYITSLDVAYLYLINTGGNFEYGMRPVDEQYKDFPLKTSYIQNTFLEYLMSMFSPHENNPSKVEGVRNGVGINGYIIGPKNLWCSSFCSRFPVNILLKPIGFTRNLAFRHCGLEKAPLGVNVSKSDP